MSDSAVKTVVVRGGMASRGLTGAASSELAIVIAAREEGASGGRYSEEDASRRGVDVLELRVEAGRTRFARRKVKNAK